MSGIYGKYEMNHTRASNDAALIFNFGIDARRLGNNYYLWNTQGGGQWRIVVGIFLS